MSGGAAVRWLLALLTAFSGLFAVIPDMVVPEIATPAPVHADRAQPRAGAPEARCSPARHGYTRLAVPFGHTVYGVLTYLPKSYAPGLPMVLNLHGSGGTGIGQQRLTGITRAADEHRFVVVAPNGGSRAGTGYAWNVPGVPLADGRRVPAGARNDVEFLAATIRTAGANLCTDRSRVYATGHSGGGRMVSALGCARADLLAAIAPVSGLRAGPPDPADPSRPASGGCRPSRPLPVLDIHGTGDEVNPYAGGGRPYWGYSVATAVATWNRLDNCLVFPLVLPISRHGAMGSTIACAADAEVDSYSLRGAGHIWPGSPGSGPAALLNREIDATGTIWEFFSRHRISRR
jgi:polyhydroxybutyrate depolymerase